ncbi:MAG TPA: SMC-Scp complex subunit ScpB [Candidatus Krumholzibacteria bacterium]|nr:SMC-Scp complex subunit ScpB [Candidatus Krumholzibacteria bacterium]
MRRELEALLFATDQPLSVARLAGYFPGVERSALKKIIEELQAEYDRDEHAFTIVEFGGGYSIATRPEFAPVVKKLYRGRRKLRLSKAALEVLSIIAYKQPVTRLEIEEIRGIQASGVLGTLMERELVEIVGRAEGLGSPLLYGTTATFLEYLGLRSLKELPRLSELEDLLSEREEIKQLAGQMGEEITDEEFEAVVNPPLPEEEEKPAAGNGDEAPEAGEADASLSRSEGAAD